MALPERQSDEATEQAELKALVDAGRYLDAYHTAVEYWGRHEFWQEKEKLNLLSRILRGLGRIRSAEYVNFCTYRKWPDDSLAAIHHILHSTSFRGAIECYRDVESWLEKVSDNESDTADWLVVKAIVLLNVRDFTRAHSLLDKAINSKGTRNWARRVKVNVLEAEGHRDEALLLARQCYETTDGAIELERYAELTKISEGAETALVLLTANIDKYQSVSLWNQVARYQFEQGDFDAALVSLTRGEELQIFGRDKYDELAQYIRNQIIQEKQDSITKLPVPHIAQKHMTCAPSSIAAIARYWGLQANEDEIATQICFDGTEDRLQRKWLDENGFSFVDFDLSKEAAAELMKRKVPFTLVTTAGLSSHLQVVKGMDYDAGLLYFMDPSLNSESNNLIDNIYRQDSASGPRCRAIAPKDKPELLSKHRFASTEMYPIKNEFDVQVERNDIQACRQLISRVSQIDENHRITVQMKRTLAIALNDEESIAAYTDTLLERYPTNVPLLLSKYYSLKTTKGHKEAFAWLQAQYEICKETDLLNMLLEDIQISDDAEATKKALLKRKAMWSNAKYFWLEGNDAWVTGDKENAAIYYYWALCLEPGNAGYLRSYFLTYLDQGKAEEALETLKSIHQSSIRVNPSVAYSLYRAYCFRGREHLGLDVLENACEVHPEDTVLIAFYLQELTEKGQWQRFDREYTKYASLLPDIERKKLAALNYLDKGDNHAAITEYEALLRLIPGDLTTMERLIDAYNRSGLTKQAEEFLDRQKDILGERLSVLSLIAQNSRDKSKKISTLERLVELYPAEFDALRELAYYYLSSDNIESAKSIFVQLNDKDPEYVENLLLRANICLTEGDWSEAKSIALNAIKSSPNHTNAFHMLMRTHVQPEEKKQVLKAFAKELEALPNADDGVWNFWHTAKHWFSNIELRAFCDSMIARHGDNWCVWVVSAYQKEIENDLAGAVYKLDKAAEIAPLTARVFVEKARLLSILGREQQANDAFEYAATLSPGWDYIAIEHYKHCERYSDIRTGLAILERCKKFNDRDAVLRGYIAECYYSLGRIDRALELLVEAIERMFDYSWAWDKLRLWSEEAGKAELWREMLIRRQQDAPGNVDTWIISAQQSSDDNERLKHLNRAVEIEPTNIEANIELLDMLISLKKEQQALDLIHDSIWGDSPPITLAIKECRLIFGQGDKHTALEKLEKLLNKSPRYIEGWLQLMKWAADTGDQDKAKHCAEQLEAIAGNDAESLCEVGAFYERSGSEEQQSRVLLLYERAFILAPDSGTAAFSLLDRLIFEQHFERAWTLAEKMQSSFQQPWIDARKVELSLRQGQVSEALGYYQNIVKSREETAWLYYHPLEVVDEVDTSSLKAFEDVLLAAINEEQGNAQMAEVLARAFVSRGEIGDLLGILNQHIDSPLWSIFCDSYFDYCIENASSPEQDFWDKFDKRLHEDIWLCGQKGYVLLRAGHYYQAKAHYMDMGILERNDIPGYIYYHCASVCSDIGDWETFGKVIEGFPQAVDDSCFDNGMLWYCFNQIRKGRGLTRKMLGRIDTDNLANWEVSVYDLLQIPLKFDQLSACGVSPGGTMLLNGYKASNSDVSVTQEVKRVVINYIIKNSKLSFVKKLLLKAHLKLKL